MIELLTRQAALALNKTLASHIVKVQEIQYNPLTNGSQYEPELMLIGNNPKPRMVTQAECDEWNKRDYEEYLRLKDNIPNVNDDIVDYGEALYKFSSTDIDVYAESLANGIALLAEKLQSESLIFMLNYSIPWLSQDNDYAPVKAALNYLTEVGMEKSFIGAIKASGDDLKKLLVHLFWISRCNASLPPCYFSGVNADYVTSICQYGNIHMYFYSKAVKVQTIIASKEIGMEKIYDRVCRDNFSQDLSGISI